MKLYINYKRINGISKDEKEESIKKELIKNINLKTKKYVLKRKKAPKLLKYHFFFVPLQYNTVH